MKYLKKLTPEQEALIKAVGDEWLDLAFNSPVLDRVAARKGIEWCYEIASLKKPEVLFVSSPLAAQLAANFMVHIQKDTQIWKQVEDQVLDPIMDQVEARVEDQIAIFYRFVGANWSYFGWAAWSDFYSRIGLVSHAKLGHLLDFLRSNVFDFIALDGLAIVCEPPSTIKRDEQDRLSSIDGPAIEWSDGFKLWYIDGVCFEFELWEKITSKSLTPKEIFALNNIEQRMIAVKLAEVNSILETMEAKLVDKSARGNELYLVKDFFSSAPRAFFLKYACPSTGRIFLSGIDPEFAEGKKADECMSWKHNMSLEQYNSLTKES